MARTNREFVQLAHTYNGKDNIAGKYVSEKLDGVRAFWDGGVTTGLPIEEVPWANLVKSGGGQLSTGLWSRYGHPFHAPQWWLDRMPSYCLDGELWTGRGGFQTTVSIVKRLPENSLPWEPVKYCIFDKPSPMKWLQAGRINSPQYSMDMTAYILTWYAKMARNKGIDIITMQALPFWLYVKRFMCGNDVVVPHKQEVLPMSSARAYARLMELHAEVRTLGGEGLILRDPDASWEPLRCKNLLKVVDRLSDECIVVGYVSAELGKIHGKIGALVVSWRNIEFELSGFTDLERELEGVSKVWATANPGVRAPSYVVSHHFPIGKRISFQYRELTDAGVPKTATYWREGVEL
jgi:DNA ligase-1